MKSPGTFPYKAIQNNLIYQLKMIEIRLLFWYMVILSIVDLESCIRIYFI